MKSARNAMFLRIAFASTAIIAGAQASAQTTQPPAETQAIVAQAREAAEQLLAKPDARPERLYNAGVAMYRAGELGLARDLFEAAAGRGRADLASRSMYNRGTTRYAESLKEMQAAQQPGQASAPDSPQDTQQQVMETLERAVRELKDAVRADPANENARANAELAHRVLKELKQQQDKQQKQQKDDQKKDDQQKQDQQKQDQQKQDQQKQDQQKQDQQKQDQQKQDQQKQDQQKQDQQKQDQQKQDQQQQQQADGKQERKPMTKQEVERLLQKIRDKEKARMQEQLERQRVRTQPAPKDW